MKYRTSRPLLRATALTTSMLACTSTSSATPESSVRPASTAQYTEHHRARVHLRGTVHVLSSDKPRVYLVISTASGDKTLDLHGPWPAHFDITDADLDGLDTSGDSVRLTAYYEDGSPPFLKHAVVVPLHTSSIMLVPNTPYDPPVPNIPTREQVLAMPPATPDQPGSAIDIQGVLVFNNDHAVSSPEYPKMGLRLAGEKGAVNIPLTGQSPVRFRIQDADLSASTLGNKLTLSATLHFGDGKMLQQEVEVRPTAKGIILVPYDRPPIPPSPILRTVDVDIQGVVNPPREGEAVKVSITAMGALGGGPTVLLPEGPWPRPFHLAGPEWTDIPINGKEVLIFAKITLKSGEELTDTLSLPPTKKKVVFQPHPLALRPMKIAEPVYGNTKGSRYDEGFRGIPTDEKK